MFSSLLPPPKHSGSVRVAGLENELKKMPNLDMVQDYTDVEPQTSALYEDTIPLMEQFPNLKHNFPRYTLQNCPDESLKSVVESTRDFIHKLLNPVSTQAETGTATMTPVSITEENMQRTVEVSTYKEDPMLPPKFKLRKNRAAPPPPPPPILKQAPPVTKEMKDQWHIPLAVSNWKNQRGFALSLEKRIMASKGGGGADETPTFNVEGFSSLSLALSKAEKQAREDIRIRNEKQTQLALEEKERKTQQLKELVEKNRRENANKRRRRL